MNYTVKINAEAAIVGAIIMFVCNTVIYVAGWGIPDAIEQLAVYTSFVCTYLCVVQSRFNYIWGVVTTALLSIVFWRAGLYGSMVVNIYLIPTLIYGWFVWGPDNDTKRVEHVKIVNIPLYLIATAITYLGALGVVTWFGGEMAILDSWILIGTVLAQWLLDRKKIETWLVWVAVNVVSIYVYFNQELYAVTFQYVFFLMNTAYGAYMWNKSMKETGDV